MLCFAAFLDAIKAFDNLWRQALFQNMKKSNNIILKAIILLKTYYDKLSSKIKINHILSKLIKLSRGVKQGGVMSGALFNFFIDDLIHECCQAGIGASFINIIIAIICFCDDICLMIPDANELQMLLNICDNYSKKWALEYNISKCKFMVFGNSKLNNFNFLLNDRPITFSNNYKYLGIEFDINLDFFNFFIKKFGKVRIRIFLINMNLKYFVYI